MEEIGRWKPGGDAQGGVGAVVPRVLVVQTRADVARAHSSALAGAGWEAIVHPDGQGVPGAIEVWAPQVVLVDLTLPALDGWCVLAEIGGMARPPGVVVRLGDPDDADRAVALGADAWVGDAAHIVAAAGRLVPSIAA
jgi:DNA-binding response OmpR family regulator